MTPRHLAARLLLLVVALAFAALARHIYVDIFGSQVAYAYMGIRVRAVENDITALFLALAVAPALWLPVHMRRPSDVMQIFLFYAVHIPSCMLLPIVSYESTLNQFMFAVAITLGLLCVDLRYVLPRLQAPQSTLSPVLFWGLISIAYIACLVLFARSGYVSLDALNMDVYEQRLELRARKAEIGPAFFYAANWTGVALAPFLIIAGVYKRHWLLISAGILIATISFLASSNKINIMAVPAVLAGYLVLRLSRGRHLASVVGASFGILGLMSLQADSILLAYSGIDLPIVTWSVFHRAFTNNGFLSAIYLDLFTPLDPVLYADSLLRWLPDGPRLALPIPAMAGASFTSVPDVWANANLWADGFANAGYAGIAFAALSALLLMWIYDAATSGKNSVVAAVALILPSTVVANTTVHNAFMSNGVAITMLLMLLWSGGSHCSERTST